MAKHFLITAGPTHEPLDPVRYLTNRSSGKMGYALAGAAAHEGHRVTLISGPCDLEVPEGVDYLPVETAAEMYEAVSRYIGKAQIAIFAAAVADYRPVNVPEQKIKKTGNTLTLELVKNPDILGSAREVFGYKGTLIGFAAETENVEDNARGKLQRKGCDFVVANDVSRQDIGFNASENEVSLVYANHTEALPKDDKYQLSLEIIKKSLEV
ncbi:phosphopantothenoylcysteine decarboxylase [Rubritalea profundi]|uniref:Phosphopantothenoylcysteine decarboxylase n=1 Tax=Rubritalea profundi TaxID=1658618 RepID=A0A2S7TXL6_9BACT|nr:phosphopantothenoylcysteine decarboxylase [Rubritalea profundi]PQJ27060.1 phosphopantothenoylcysteine decarboxylase [Rubritalea profundi]